VNTATFVVKDEKAISDLEDVLIKMKVYPWITEQDDGSAIFEIENHRELERLQFFGVLKDAAAPTEEVEEAELSPVFVDEYAFPLPPTPPSVPPTKNTQPRIRAEKPVENDEDPLAVDMWMEQATDNFDSGRDIEPEEEKEISPQFGPNLKLYKREYFFRDGSFYKNNGEVISLDEHKDILVAAKNDPEKMDQAVRMSVGLVKMVVDRVMKKFSTNEIFDEDDVFQAGMEGLLYGLSHFESRSTSPTSYLVPCIEGSIRGFLRKQKPIFSYGSSSNKNMVKYLRERRKLEHGDGRFHSLTREQQEERVADAAGLTLEEARSVLKQLNAKRVSLDEEQIDPEFTYNEKPLIVHGSDEHERFHQLFNEAMETLSVREEMMLRLHFGMVGGDRVKNIKDVRDIFERRELVYLKSQAVERLEKLYRFDLEKDDFGSLSRAEQMFVVMLGKAPESLVEYLHNNDPYHPTDLTLDDIGSIFGVSRERVRGVVNKALRKMKHPMRNATIRDSGYFETSTRTDPRTGRVYTSASIDERELT
jgi:RNA polymerase sigma factor (sigma-70 family)